MKDELYRPVQQALLGGLVEGHLMDLVVAPARPIQGRSQPPDLDCVHTETPPSFVVADVATGCDGYMRRAGRIGADFQPRTVHAPFVSVLRLVGSWSSAASDGSQNSSVLVPAPLNAMVAC